jgi:hypothetical protein
LPVGARTVALGRALTARAAPEAAFANPAGLAGLESPAFMVHHTTLAGQATAFSLLLTPARIGTVGLSYQLLDFGDIEMTDERGQTVGTLFLRHHLLVTSYATSLGAGLAVGGNYKFYRDRVSCQGRCSEQEVSATAHVADLGVRFAPSSLPALQFGALVSNVGSKLRAGEGRVADPLPSRLRVGAAYELLGRFIPEHPVSLWLAFELEDELRALGSPTPAVGIEVNADDAAFLRAGYIPGDGIGAGTSVGVGLRYTRFTLSLAKVFGAPRINPDAEPVQLSFGISL